jgi:hypothetical protein
MEDHAMREHRQTIQEEDNCRQQVEQLKQEMINLQKQLSDAEEMIDYADQLNRDLEKKCTDLENLNASKETEIKRLQQAVFANAGSDCDTCDDKNTPNCPGPDLCGKKILYVGGMHKLVQHYRKMIEQAGGAFMHHDGGKEIAKSRLPNMIGKADAVLCPVDCVSHDACLSVKRHCKQSNKPYFMMRGSGLSSLAKSLEKIS